MYPSLVPFLVFFIGAGALLVCQQFFFQYLYDVKLGAEAVEIVIFKRFVIHSIPYEEIAAALGLPLATVKVKVHRARLKLAKIRNQGVSA